MKTFLRHARERKRALDEEEKNASRALTNAWSCLDAGGGGEGGAAEREQGVKQDANNASPDKENFFVILVEFVNKFDREVKSTENEQ